MNKTIWLVFLILCVSCKKNIQSHLNEKDEFEFVLQGSVKNGDGKSLELIIPSKNMDETIISQIKDGKYFFKGYLNTNERVGLRIADNETDQWPKKLFLNKDTLILDLEIGRKYDEITFVSDSIINSSINEYAENIDSKYWEINSGVIISRNITKRDSLRKYIYPEIKRKTLKLAGEEIANDGYDVVILDLLRTIVADNDIFNPENLAENEKKQMEMFFGEIDVSLSNSEDYKFVANQLNNLLQKETNLSFQDFELLNIDGTFTKLSNVISNNEFTVVDFWWSGCVPCRKFNQEGQEFYKTLKEKGIEIVAVNVDHSKNLWESASLKDNIGWINVYAGNNSSIIPAYNVTAYPTKVIFNNKKEIVDFDFKSVKDLNALIDQ